ncbi:MAG: chorismate synthase, partial [Dehalococcoidaceae bacterium]|nr:chorismate synthase [Dehalococcoidaceae bacterium]
KYGGFADHRGGGRFSGRITAGFVLAGALAKQLLAGCGIEVLAHTVEIGGIAAAPSSPEQIRNAPGQNELSCADSVSAANMLRLIRQTREEGDSLGGIIEIIGLGLPAGLGEPVFDTIDGDIAKALFAVPAVKGVEFGAGFDAARLKGSLNNDPYIIGDGLIQTSTNNAGGVAGGMSTGMPLRVRVAVKPTPSIAKIQDSVDLKSCQAAKLKIRGRHDTCIVPRAVAVVEAITAVVIADFAKRAQIIPGVLK